MSLWQRFLALFRRKPDLATPRFKHQCASGLIYAEKVTKKKPLQPVEWVAVRGTYKKLDGRWYHSGAGARTQFLPERIRIVVYVGPDSEQAQDVFNHDAGHACLGNVGHPAKWRKYFANWVDT